MNLSDRGELVAGGTWLYAGSVQCRLAIVRRGFWYGTGDHEDPPELANDRSMETFEVLYELPNDSNQFSGGGQHLTLEDARAEVIARCGDSVTWEEL